MYEDRPSLWVQAILLALALVFALVGTIYSATHRTADAAEPSSQSVHLPSKCAPYYNDGTDRWKDCMGVGYQ